MNGGIGQHRIEGIGDKMCTLIHNVLTTDFVALISDEDSVRGLKIIHDAPHILVENGVDPVVAESLRDIFGVSTICNIIGAIKMAKYLKLGTNDNIVTVATDGFNRYHSVIDNLNHRVLETEDFVLRRWFKDIFLKVNADDVDDLRSMEKKERLFKQKEHDWLRFDYSIDYLNQMRHMKFWNDEYELIKKYDKKIIEKRGKEL
jgi:hypothetical protein